MGIVDIILGRKSVYRIRKEYDKLREKVDREPNLDKRLAILHILDSIEPSIVVLEEHYVSNFERRRMTKFINQNMKRAKFMLRDKDYFKSMLGQEAKQQQAQQQRRF